MPAAWETWTLLWLSALQFAVAYWWWKGPFLEGTRGWVTALFALNAVVTLRPVIGPAFQDPAVWFEVAATADRYTLVTLLAVGTTGLGLQDRFPRASRTALGTILLVFLVLTPYWFLLALAGESLPAWNNFLMTATQLVAGIAIALGIVVRARRPPSAARDAWLLALAGAGLRYADLSMKELFPTVLVEGMTGSGFWIPNQLLRVVMVGALVAAFAALLLPYFRDATTPSLAHDASLAFLLGGLVLGAGRALGPGNFSALIFSFAFLRPLAFVGSQVTLEEGSWDRSSQPRRLALGAALFAGSVVAVQIGDAWATSVPAALGFGAAVVVVAVPLLRRVDVPVPALPETQPGDGDRGRWPIEEERVALPDDWERTLEERLEAYQELPPGTREALDDLTRWERITLALDGAPDGNPLPPYERTTPGLHFTTHCPYSSVGPTISRANDRAGAIRDEMDIRPPDSPTGDESLVEGSWGRAEGLDSPRVKHYELTPLGERVAAALRERVGLGDADPGEVAQVVGEGFGDR